MEEYQWNPNFENFELYPEHINNDSGLIYHGTSTVYSNDIETNGFRINHLPFPIEDLQEIINLLTDLGQPSNYNPEEFQINFNHAGAIDHYISNRHPISFTVAGYPALKFASGQSKGGQIVGKIKQALDHISELINEIPDGDLRRIEFAERFERIQHIDNRCAEIINNQGVIYVIRPSKEILQHLYVDHKVIFSRETIPIESIIAKITVDADYELDADYRQGSESIINRHFSTPKSIGFHLFKRQLEYEDNEDN